MSSWLVGAVLPSAPELLGYALLLLAGVLAGWLNTIAGGGSLLTVPALMWYGLPADLANGTSRVAILAQGVTAVMAFWREKKLEVEQLVQVAVPSVVGAVLGAYASTLIPNRVLTPLIIATLLIMAASMFLKPSTFAPPVGAVAIEPRRKPSAMVALFFAGFYGGFLQAGVGLVLLAVFASLLHIDLVRGNGLKVAVVFLYSIVVVMVFAARARVALGPGAVLALGQSVGALLGVRFAVTRGQGAIQRVVFVMVVALALALLFR